MKKYESEFKFLDYNVNYLKIELNDKFNDEECDLKIKFDYEVENIDNIYRVTLITEIGDKGTSPFVLNASISGNFLITSENIDSEMIDILVNQNTLAILFPYLRSLITTVTANCNINPVILPTVNIAKMLKNNQNEKLNN